MEKIGLFGGCFNPPSNIHISLANNLIKYNYFDKVVFVPVGDYYKKKDLISAKDRYNMLKIAIKDFKNIEIDDIILNHKENLYAVDSFKILSEKYKNTDFYFIMGSDNFEKMPQWKDYNIIINKYKYLVIERENHEDTINYENIVYYKSQQKDISATQIRKMIKNNININELLNKDVLNYIRINKLYQ